MVIRLSPWQLLRCGFGRCHGWWCSEVVSFPFFFLQRPLSEPELFLTIAEPFKEFTANTLEALYNMNLTKRINAFNYVTCEWKVKGSRTNTPKLAESTALYEIQTAISIIRWRTGAAEANHAQTGRNHKSPLTPWWIDRTLNPFAHQPRSFTLRATPEGYLRNKVYDAIVWPS